MKIPNAEGWSVRDGRSELSVPSPIERRATPQIASMIAISVIQEVFSRKTSSMISVTNIG